MRIIRIEARNNRVIEFRTEHEARDYVHKAVAIPSNFVRMEYTGSGHVWIVQLIEAATRELILWTEQSA